MELACIRWFATHVIFLQFFTNIVLIACFVGMSLGCLCASGRTDWLARFPRLALWSCGLAVLIHAGFDYWKGLAIDVGAQASPQVVFFGTEYRDVDLATFVIPLEVLAGVFFVLIALMFVGLGQVLGRCFDAYPNRVVAYTLNIAGSLAGIVAFSALSFAGTPPIVWFLVSYAGVGFFLRQAGKLKRDSLIFMAVAAMVILITGTSWRSGYDVLWSPYYSIHHDHETRRLVVNTIGHQEMVSYEEPAPVYSLVHLMQRDVGGTPYEEVLIIGAGSGNDIAHALAGEVSHVDAVEIDPVIQQLGEQYHPDQPYSDPRVTVYLNDGRNFLRRTDKKYDLVVFALVDSLILHSSYSNLRLESFLFTEQAFRDVKNVLKDNGVFVMYNVFRQGWIVERIAKMLEETFDEEPLVFSLPYVEKISANDPQKNRMTAFLVGDTDSFRTAFENHGEFQLNQYTANNQSINGFEFRPPARERGWLKIAPAQVDMAGSTLRLSTDDWPFLYLRSRSIPGFYLRGIAVIGGLGLILLFALAPGHKVSFNGRMFFLGAAFLLLETKAVVHFALIFGSTWLVNSLVFFSILVMILGSNLYVLKSKQVDLRRHYVALFLCLVLYCVVPLDTFLAGHVLWKYVAPCALAMVPIFFAGVIFAVTFRESKRPDLDFGSNIAGAVIGGLAEYSSMLLGFRYLLLLVILFYALSAVFRKKETLPFVER